MNVAQHTYELAAAARNAYASEVFDREIIAVAILEQATSGSRHLRVVQTHPYNLKETKPAYNLEEWLDLEGFRYGWHPASVPADPLRPASGWEYHELLITW